MWTKEIPLDSGSYWFYGDPFWSQLPHNEEEGINPFKPELYIIEVNRERFLSLVCSGAFCYGVKGVFWDTKIESPELPTL